MVNSAVTNINQELYKCSKSKCTRVACVHCKQLVPHCVCDCKNTLFTKNNNKCCATCCKIFCKGKDGHTQSVQNIHSLQDENNNLKSAFLNVPKEKIKSENNLKEIGTTDAEVKHNIRKNHGRSNENSVKNNGPIKIKTEFEEDNALKKLIPNKNSWPENVLKQEVITWEKKNETNRVKVECSSIYQKLPEEIQFYYNGAAVELSIAAEEVACHYAHMGPKYTKDETFKNNFFKDWKRYMSETERSLITDLNKCNFEEIRAYLRLRTKHCFYKVHEVKSQVCNFQLPQMCLFYRSRNNPKRGMVMKGVMPEDVTINIDKEEPLLPAGYKWKEVIYNPNVKWFASWKHSITGKKQYNRPTQVERPKFEIARRLHKHIEKIRSQYTKMLKSRKQEDVHLGVALYFIDELVIRIGHPKDTKIEADTVGVCSLRVEHVTFHDLKYVIDLNFIAKSGGEYSKSIADVSLYNSLQRMTANKSDGDKIFDKISPYKLNKYVKTETNNEGITTKTFRTYHACLKMESILEKFQSENKTLSDKVSYLNKAILEVAELLNHRKTKANTQEQVPNGTTTLQHYVDPRIIISWCLQHNVPISKVYKKQLKMYNWAIEEIKPGSIFKF